ncbi:hypothetical protein J6590_035556, partial [Homalodisca vitripennis]
AHNDGTKGSTQDPNNKCVPAAELNNSNEHLPVPVTIQEELEEQQNIVDILTEAQKQTTPKKNVRKRVANPGSWACSKRKKAQHEVKNM